MIASNRAAGRCHPASIYFAEALHVGPLPAAGVASDSPWDAACRRARAVGAHTLMIPLPCPADPQAPFAPRDLVHSAPGDAGAPALAQGVAGLAALCERHGLALVLALSLRRVHRACPLAASHPEWFVGPDEARAHGLDPRLDAMHRITVHVRTDPSGRAPSAFIADWADRLLGWALAGAAGFCVADLDALAAPDWRDLIGQVRAGAPGARFFGWTPGLSPAHVSDLAGVGLDAVFASLPWWDYRSPWLAEEHMRLSAVAAVIAPLADAFSGGGDVPPGRQRLRAAAAAEVAGDAVMIPMGWEASQPDAHEEQRTLQALRDAVHALQSAPLRGRLHCLPLPGAAGAALLRGDGWPYSPPPDEPTASPARAVIVNADASAALVPDWDALRTHLPDGYAILRGDGPQGELPGSVPPAGSARLAAARAPAVLAPPGGRESARRALVRALAAPRVVIAAVSPAVDDGLFALKAVVGRPVQIEADIFMDGHDRLAAALLWRAADEATWREVPMRPLGNDRWQGRFVPERIGQHYCAIRAWRDAWRSYADDLAKKHAAGVDLTLDIEEGRQRIDAALAGLDRSRAAAARRLAAVQSILGPARQVRPRRGRPDPLTEPLPRPTPEQIAALLAESTAAAMDAAGNRTFETTTADAAYPVWVDRPAAAFASWYELFPRSQSGDPGRHGTFDDVIARLPAIRDMGFDVLYFPPIHPIGRTHRKGRNDSLRAGPGDPGSPYAIGAAEGGHDALHPGLGTLDDFHRLVAAARLHGLEIALDFAIQCSPDHPWLSAHPEWFDWRPDGSIRYAENPPKKYEDIVNVDFYGVRGTAARQAALWRALRDVVLFWIDQGVRTFRVDNPHTKPLPFWQWLIADVRARHPEAIFLSEAFTRPKMMYRLAKLGFTQSYTYFTWRETKAEFIAYMTELTGDPVARFFRPNFFVNTPDINPRHLQSGGRPAFLIRAALAATLSGLWGVYNGFELCEAAAVPGKEEYLDAEKYEIRAWDWNRPGNIVAEIAQLNRIRRTNPALHSHLGLRFHHADDDSVLFFSKAAADGSNVVLAAINLDPHADHGTHIELPMWLAGQPDDGVMQAHDLLHDHRQAWHGKHQYLDLPAERPYRLWRIPA